ncbi:LLM class F420-dependent oxidoreductase [soil metagenome]
MHHWVTYPLVTHPTNPEFLSADALGQFVAAAEAAGFAGIGFTDHPAPSHKWLQAGGHDALDPFAALAFVAARSTRLRLIPHILVLPYRNPFLVAKAAATLDMLSGGRFIMAVAAGYQRSEFNALGVDYDARNDRFDEAIEVLRGVWSTDDFAYDGATFKASGQTANPKPAHIPIWIGGNSALARRRVATYGDGWCPFPAPAGLSRTTRTPTLETVDDFARMLADLARMTEEQGRDPKALDVAFRVNAGGQPSADGFDADAHGEELAELAAIGMTWNGVGIPGDSLAHALETLDRYRSTVIAAG